jgi:DNA-binding response OmpR family regulator
MSGLDLLKTLRGNGHDVPIIMVTAKGDLGDRVEGLDRGADDYLVKPFEMAELISRVNALYRRSVGHGSSELILADLRIDLATMRVSIAGQPLELTAKEYDLLVALAGKVGQLVTRSSITGLLYPMNMEPDSNSLDVLLARLRRKLNGSGVEIETLRAKGFLLRVA